MRVRVNYSDNKRKKQINLYLLVIQNNLRVSTLPYSAIDHSVDYFKKESKDKVMQFLEPPTRFVFIHFEEVFFSRLKG